MSYVSLRSKLGAAVLIAALVGSVAAAPKKPAEKKKASTKTAAKAAAKPAAGATAAQIAAGKKVYEATGCAACHKIAGKGGASGPDLTKIGKEHDAAWLTKKIQNPKSMHPNSIMPAFTGPPQDLKALVAYMTSLK